MLASSWSPLVPPFPSTRLVRREEREEEVQGRERWGLWGPAWASRVARRGEVRARRGACTSTYLPSLVRRVQEGASREMALR